jgi:hypothetical protein
VKRRLIVAFVALIVLAAVAVPIAQTFGGRLLDAWAILFSPLVVCILPGILLPRRLAIGWGCVVTIIAASLSVIFLRSAEQCSGDGCIGIAMAAIFVGIPSAVIGCAIALSRYFLRTRPGGLSADRSVTPGTHHTP